MNLKISILCLAAAFLFGCNDTKPEKPQPPVKWEYQQFNFKGPNFDLRLVTMVRMVDGFDMQSQTVKYGDPVNCLTLDQALNQIGRHGWEFCWKDGETILVKRNSNSFTNGNFSVFYERLPDSRK